jgi:hypothetical protein
MEVSNVVTWARNAAARFAAGLGSLLEGIAAYDAPKVVVVFSEGIASPEAPGEFAAFATQSAAARAAIYAMRLERPEQDASISSGKGFAYDDRLAGIAGLDAVVGRARGTVFEVHGSGDIPFQRLARELSGYYLIGVEPEGNDRNGQPHHLSVKVRKPGLTVRARPQFVFNAAVTDENALLTAALRSPLSLPGLPLKVATFNLADKDPALVRVVIAAEIDRGQQSASEALVGFVFLDAEGKVYSPSSERMRLEKSRFSETLSLVVATTVQPGTYTLRVAAVHDGRTGSVEHRVTARLTSAASLQLGDLVVCDPPLPKAGLSPSLDGRVHGDRLWSFVQLAPEKDMPKDVSLVLDILKSEKGSPVVSAPLRLAASATRPDTAQVTLDARLLPPGKYLARLTVSSGGKAAARLITPFSLERSPRDTRRPAAGPASKSRPPDVAAFNLADVLDRAVLDPFLDEVAASAPAAARAAIDKARAGQFDEAVKLLGTGAPSEASGPFIRGLALLARGDLQLASEAFRDMASAAPDLLVAAFYIGACYAAGGRETQAINAWRTSLTGLDRYPAVYRFLADALIRAGEPDRARDLLEEALSRFPAEDALVVRMGKALFEMGRYAEALEQVERVIERRTDAAAVLLLALQSAFRAAEAGAALPYEALLPRLRRYRDLYVAAQGPEQALVSEWVAFIESKAKRQS